MLNGILKAIFGSSNDRYIKKLRADVEKINAFEAELEKLSDEELRNKTEEFKKRLAGDDELKDVLHEAFAVVREASKRVTGMRHFDVQMIGGLILHAGRIAEMKTGEGKTLVATLPVYLNALTGEGVHVVTVNDYLARRDAEQMGKIYNFLGMTVGVIEHGLTDNQRREAYAADITYGTNHEFGFDYLRDNMKFNKNELVQREFNYAIVDEVDSILIDEARTPLIISGPAEDSSELYKRVSDIVKTLSPEDYAKDAKDRNITLTEVGTEKIEKLLKENGIIESDNLYDFQNINIVHYVNQSLKAWNLFEKEVDYVVKDGEVIIVDEFTGRMMEGRRYSDGLHQAIEAKENVEIQMENQTLASITYQNFFRLYKKLAGMTGTAMTEAAEFQQIYNLETSVVPTNLPVIRKDENDEVYGTFKEKCTAIVNQIKVCNERNQPVLVGTASIEKSELISAILKKEGIKHNVLNAKYHEYEAQIIADAGVAGAVTIATNMAGRGTDIKLGGNAEMRIAELYKTDTYSPAAEERILAEVAENAEIVKQAGGLYILGTERHESRRIDNQLRGRSGRQGDPGQSKFFLSLEDDLMKIFGSEKLQATLQRLGLEENEAIVHPWVNKAIEKAQTRVEARNFEIRKHLLKFDDVMNNQRKIIYSQRHDLISDDYDIIEDVRDFASDVIDNVLGRYYPDDNASHELDVENLTAYLSMVFNYEPTEPLENSTKLTMSNTLEQHFEKVLEEKSKFFSDQQDFNRSLKAVVLKTLDKKWKDHLLSLDHLRQGINLRAYAQKDPLNEYKIEAFNLFEEMIYLIKEESISLISKFVVRNELDFSSFEDLFNINSLDDLSEDPDADLAAKDEREKYDMIKKRFLEIAKNTKCYCGSGKKFMDCHGKSL